MIRYKYPHTFYICYNYVAYYIGEKDKFFVSQTKSLSTIRL